MTECDSYLRPPRRERPRLRQSPDCNCDNGLTRPLSQSSGLSGGRDNFGGWILNISAFESGYCVQIGISYAEI